VSLVLVAITFGPNAGGFAMYGLALLPLAAAAAFAHPRLLVPFANGVARLTGRTELAKESVLSARAMTRAVALYTTSVLANGLGFYFVMRAVAPVGPSEVPAAVGIYNLAGVVGVLAVLVPSGLGVREGVITALVSVHAPLEVAVTV